MKHFKLIEKENLYALLSEKAIYFMNEDDDKKVIELIENKKVIGVPVHFLEDIKEIIFIDSDCSIEISFNDSDTDEIELDIDENLYNNFKTFFIEHIQNVNIKDYSMLKQLKAPLLASVISGGFTWLLYSIAISIRNGESVRTSGRRGFIKKIFVWVADLLGPTGSLIVGGLFTALFLYGVFSAIFKTKEGKVIKIGSSPKFNLLS